MSQEISISENKMPTIQELYLNPELALKQDQLMHYLNQPPPAAWIKIHPYISGYKYLPIEKIEFLLKKIYKKYRIEILREGTAFNGVYVVIRLYYQDLISGEMEWQDGIGAIQLQTAKGTSPADLANINNGALSMAFPLAETIAIKDATDKLGDIFGANLNRKDVLAFQMDTKLATLVHTKEEERLIKLIDAADSIEILSALKEHLTERINEYYIAKWDYLQEKLATNSESEEAQH